MGSWALRSSEFRHALSNCGDVLKLAGCLIAGVFDCSGAGPKGS